MTNHREKFRRLLLYQGVRDLDDLGYPGVQPDAILSNALFSSLFSKTLEMYHRQHLDVPDMDVAIDQLMVETGTKTPKSQHPEGHLSDGAF